MFIQGGRIRGECNSVFEKEFSDESFHVKHNEAGMLGMCKRSGLQNTNESQFYITTGAPLTFLDGKNVVFGRVIRGYDTVQLIENYQCNYENPVDPIKITLCGEFTQK